MMYVPWDEVHSAVDRFAQIFVFPPEPQAITFNQAEWQRLYPYAPLTATNSTTASRIIRINAPLLRFQQFFGGPTSRKFTLSAQITLNAVFLQFLQTLDSSFEQQLRAFPNYERIRFQGLIKKVNNVRLLELPIDEDTDFFMCNPASGVTEEIDRERALRTWTISRAPCRPKFRIDSWYINRIFQCVRIKIVCESLTFYPGRDSQLVASRSLESLQQRHDIFIRSGIDIDTDLNEDERSGAWQIPYWRASQSSANPHGYIPLQNSGRNTSRSSSSGGPSRVNISREEGQTFITIESDEEARLRNAKQSNVSSNWCPPLLPSDSNIALEWEDEEGCCICLSNLCNANFQPCNHTCTCMPCAQQLFVRQCPVCRATITKVERVGKEGEEEGGGVKEDEEEDLF